MCPVVMCACVLEGVRTASLNVACVSRTRHSIITTNARNVTSQRLVCTTLISLLVVSSHDMRALLCNACTHARTCRHSGCSFRVHKGG
jgi:hypothetical protein